VLNIVNSPCCRTLCLLQVLELGVLLAASWKLDVWPLALDRLQHALSYQYSSSSSSSSSMSAAAAQCERAEAAIRTQTSSDSSATVWSLLPQRPAELLQALLQLYAAAPGCDLPRLDLLLRLMLECCTATAATVAAVATAGAVDSSEATAAKGSVRTEKRLQMLTGLSRRLLKSAPPALDFKHLTGGSDPLSPPATAAAAAEAALCALRGCLTPATAAAVAKLAPRLGITASAAYASCAVRVLCGADAELPPESVALLQQQQQL
jgi:hypothetical protein